MAPIANRLGATLNLLLITMFLAPAMRVSQFGPEKGQSCLTNRGFGWRPGETARSCQALKTGQFRLRAKNLGLASAIMIGGRSAQSQFWKRVDGVACNVRA